MHTERERERKRASEKAKVKERHFYCARWYENAFGLCAIKMLTFAKCISIIIKINK